MIMTDTQDSEPAASEDVPGQAASPVRATTGAPLSVDQAARVLRAVPYGGIDDSTASLRLPPPVAATVSPVIAAIRWGALLFGMVQAAPQASDGDTVVVATLAVVLFLTTWRTVRPIKLASPSLIDRVVPFTDTAIVGIAVGWSNAFQSPFVFCLLAAAAVGAFGWGLPTGLTMVALATVGTIVGSVMTGNGINIFDAQAFSFLLSFGISVGVIGFARGRLLEAERRRNTIAGQLDMLEETNDLLHVLNQVTRTLPTSLDLREATDNARDQIRAAFEASVVALVVYDDVTDEWVPQITDGCALRPSSTELDLPAPMARALQSSQPILLDYEGGEAPVASGSKGGLYAAVRARDRVIGVLAVEHPTANHYTERELRIMDGLGDVLALTVDNARSFRRLRTLGAEEERSRIARDLHDRLGQWLSYISFELDRIISTDEESSPELAALQSDVQTAIDELRETLRQLRSGVTEDEPLALVARQLVERFNQRGGALATFTVHDNNERLPVKVENEFLRILQESLSNVNKHAMATRVDILWQIEDDVGTLVITDDGKGFDPEHGIRDSAYGLKGMRERAESVDARLTVRSAPGEGTQIVVRAGTALEGVT